MLQIKNLVKIYRPKKGVPVRALDNVSLVLPQTGMVFLLGKSGSGKSTLLNLLGGLDRYDSGDILIQGKTTRKFRQRHFDSYRNTYVGFIFQEYNILEEFSVGANIALALQLQGQKADSARINAILREVDLEGYGSRKPNELSGGQKQRVAIARALVKNPKIIMADEPTGALDSATGRQVLTTLKKLSREKLVIVVSHDREFAEQYGDRIIELADGRVIRDVQRQSDAAGSGVPVYEQEQISFPEQYELTAEDEAAVLEYIQKMVRSGRDPRITILGKTADAFAPTDQESIPVSREGYRLIRSRLPLKYAFKLGASGLKYKKFRLFMTIFLSCIALIMFGLSDTMASYSYEKSSVRSLLDSQAEINYASFELSVSEDYGDGTGDGYWSFDLLEPKHIAQLRDRTAMQVFPVYGGGNASLSLSNLYIDWENYQWGSFDASLNEFRGFIEVDRTVLEQMDARVVAGTLPSRAEELAISCIAADQYVKRGYYLEQQGEVLPVEDYDALIGRQLTLAGLPYTVCGVVDTGMDIARYEDVLSGKSDEGQDISEVIIAMFFESEFDYATRYSLTGLAMIAPGSAQRIGQGEMLSGQMLLQSDAIDYENWNILSADAAAAAGEVTWLDGVSRTQPGENELLINRSLYEELQYYCDTVMSEQMLAQQVFTLTCAGGGYMDASPAQVFENMKIVGIYEDENGPACILNGHILTDGEPGIIQTLSPMPENADAVRALVHLTTEEFPEADGCYRYDLMNPVTYELRALEMIFRLLETVFFWVGLVFVIFASLLMSNFIAISISYKKQQIGILRAIGSRSNDVFRIFFAESFCIAMINFVLSFSGTAALCALINTITKAGTGLMLSILTVGPRQVIVLFVLCLTVAAVASFLPVYRIASKRPIDAIRDR